MTDTKALREIIEKRGYKLKYVAERLGLSAYGFQLKMKNIREFKTGEVSVLCDLLKIDSLEEKEKIFFAEKVDFKSTNKD